MPLKTASNSGNAGDRYFDLVRKFPLRPIRSDKELARAIEMIDSLLDRGKLPRAEEDCLEVLSDLVEGYESKEHPVPAVSYDQMLRHLIEAKGVPQVEIARSTGIAESTISDVLAGRRYLSRGHIGKLARFFGVDPGAFSF